MSLTVLLLVRLVQDVGALRDTSRARRTSQIMGGIDSLDVVLTWTGAEFFMSSSLTFSMGSLLPEGVEVVWVFLKPSTKTNGVSERDKGSEGRRYGLTVVDSGVLGVDSVSGGHFEPSRV